MNVLNDLERVCEDFGRSNDPRLKEISRILKKVISSVFCDKDLDILTEEVPAQIMVEWPEYKDELIRLEDIVSKCFKSRDQKLMILGEKVRVVSDSIKMKKRVFVLTKTIHS